jgi:hypothetical protein
MSAEPTEEAGDLRSLLETLDPKTRDDFRRVWSETPTAPD